ncbi:hypothetical protein K9N68_04610 [Kovacikia minuta CCNUW1]|uniref:hypothetical protein n=1 Tax=Kovacikia minuta TaxID=2931930 RepID=UPI001CCC5BD8|nr:hypothetical protein [Kovacikia minuta]UBF27252.1 hypothetical protein K9N68_04610 [Kovacikia minuta CCNUW1]
MSPISEVVKNALSSGYLTIEAEKTLQRLYEIGYSLEDITALSFLQRAVSSGQVKRLSQEIQQARTA